MPAGYQSIYVPGVDEDHPPNEDEPLPTFNDTYTILDPKMALPFAVHELPAKPDTADTPDTPSRQVVEYKLDVEEARKKAQAACDICGQARAVVYSPLLNAKARRWETWWRKAVTSPCPSPLQLFLGPSSSFLST